MPPHKTLERVLSGRSDGNVRFTDLIDLLRAMGFRERVRGGHHIFMKDGVREILNPQADGSRAKRYQIRQVRSVILLYELGVD